MARAFTSCLGRLSPLAATVGIINAQIADDRYVQAIASANDHFEVYWRYWMAGSSGCGLLLCVFGSLAIIVLISACKSSNADDQNEPDGDKELDELPRSDTENNAGGEILLVQGESLIAFKEPLLERLTCASVITVFVSVFFLNAAILSCKFFAVCVLGNVSVLITRALILTTRLQCVRSLYTSSC